MKGRSYERRQSISQYGVARHPANCGEPRKVFKPVVMGMRIVGMAVLPVTRIQSCSQYRCHGANLGHVVGSGNGVVVGSAGHGVTSPYALFLAHVRQHRFDALFLDGLKGLQAACLSPCFVFT